MFKAYNEKPEMLLLNGNVHDVKRKLKHIPVHVFKFNTRGITDDTSNLLNNLLEIFHLEK